MKIGVLPIDLDFAWSRRQDVINHLKEVYGEDHVAHIGTYTSEGVKSGLKDVARALNIDFNTINSITKEIDDITDEEPGITFKSIDDMKDSSVDRDKEGYKRFEKLEQDNAELFRVARKIEGCHRNAGVHASGILITPMPVTDLAPIRTSDGTAITLYTGVQLEELGFLKFDVLGLKTLDVLDKTIKSVDPKMTVIDLYDLVEKNIDDEKMFQMVRAKQTDGLFQIESNLFKGMIEDIQPTDINDIIVINSLGRPGPLKIGMPQTYARRKNGLEEAVEPLPNTWDIVESSLGTICYQEQCMLIAQRVAKFNDNQSDTYLRKAIA